MNPSAHDTKSKGNRKWRRNPSKNLAGNTPDIPPSTAKVTTTTTASSIGTTAPATTTTAPTTNPTTITTATAPYIPIQIIHPSAPSSGNLHHSHKTTVSTPHTCLDTCNLCSSSCLSLPSESLLRKGLPSSSVPSPSDFSDLIECYQDELFYLRELLKQTQIQHEAVVVTLKQQMADLYHKKTEEMMKDFSSMFELYDLRKKAEGREDLHKKAKERENLRKITCEQINQLLPSSLSKSTISLESLYFTKTPQSNSINPVLEYLAFNPQIKFNLNDVLNTDEIDQRSILDCSNFSTHNLFSIYVFTLSHLSTELICGQEPLTNLINNDDVTPDASSPQAQAQIHSLDKGISITQDFFNYAARLIGIFNPFEHFRRYLFVLESKLRKYPEYYTHYPVVGEYSTIILTSMCYIYSSIPNLRVYIMGVLFDIENALRALLYDECTTWLDDKWPDQSYSRGTMLANLLAGMIYGLYMGVTEPWNFTLTSKLFTTAEIPYPWRYSGMSSNILAGYIAHSHINWVQSNLQMNSNELIENLSNVGPHTDSLVKYLDHCYKGFTIGEYVNSYHSTVPVTPHTSGIVDFDLLKTGTQYIPMNSFTDLWAGLLNPNRVTPKFSICVLNVPAKALTMSSTFDYWTQLSDPKDPKKYIPGMPEHHHNIRRFLTTYLTQH